MNDLRIVLTACGAPGAPGIIKSLRINRERGIFILGTDMNPEAVGFVLVDEGAVVPPGGDPGFIDHMLDLCERKKADVLVPLATYELIPLAENLARFSEIGVRMAISPAESMRIANNKARLMELLFDRGIPVPDFTVVRNADEVRDAAEKLGYPDRAVCFKPAISKGSRGFRMMSSEADRFQRLFDLKPDSTQTDLNALIEVLSNRSSIPKSLVMEYLPGREYSVDILARGGEALVVIPRYRKEIRQGISHRAVTEKNDQVIALSERIISALSLHGNIGIQVREDAEGVPKVLEINPRLQGTVVLCTAAGANLPYLGVKVALGEQFDLPEVRWGVGMARFLKEIFYDEGGHTYTL